MMDRKREAELPKMQVGFIDAICMPIYKVSLSPTTLSIDAVSATKQQYNSLSFGGHHSFQTIVFKSK